MSTTARNRGRTRERTNGPAGRTSAPRDGGVSVSPWSISLVLVAAMLGMAAVSYTHLDVYKRQEYAYDKASRLVEIRFRKSDGTLIDSIAYAYDPNGRRVARTMNLPTNVETPMQGTYDEANRMTSITFPATGQTCALAYDANGNLASKACPGGTTTYTWDARDRLVAIAGPGLTASFKYDALGRRVQRVVNGLSTGYLYDGVQALAEFGANEAALLTGLAIDEAIGRFAASGDRTMLTDALGSVVAETRADQSIATAYGYSPYGETCLLYTSRCV